VVRTHVPSPDDSDLLAHAAPQCWWFVCWQRLARSRRGG